MHGDFDANRVYAPHTPLRNLDALLGRVDLKHPPDDCTASTWRSACRPAARVRTRRLGAFSFAPEGKVLAYARGNGKVGGRRFASSGVRARSPDPSMAARCAR
jgi:hypothetical protein